MTFRNAAVPLFVILGIFALPSPALAQVISTTYVRGTVTDIKVPEERYCGVDGADRPFSVVLNHCSVSISVTTPDKWMGRTIELHDDESVDKSVQEAQCQDLLQKSCTLWFVGSVQSLSAKKPWLTWGSKCADLSEKNGASLEIALNPSQAAQLDRSTEETRFSLSWITFKSLQLGSPKPRVMVAPTPTPFLQIERPSLGATSVMPSGQIPLWYRHLKEGRTK